MMRTSHRVRYFCKEKFGLNYASVDATVKLFLNYLSSIVKSRQELKNYISVSTEHNLPIQMAKFYLFKETMLPQVFMMC